MKRDDARALFSAAIDDELSEGDRATLDQALAVDPALAQEFERFRGVVLATRSLVRPMETPSANPPNLLPAVQRKLRAQSGGRFYRDRFSELAGSPRALLPLSILVACALVLGLAWVLYAFADFAS